jgi:hypothetical protein
LKHLSTVLILCVLITAALTIEVCGDQELVRLVTVWTARLTLLLFMVAFVSLGKPAVTVTRRIACRAAAFVMALHLLAIMRLVRIIGETPLKIQTLQSAVLSFGGVAAACLVLLGWTFWDRSWYRWAVYWPWSVFLFTYVFLARHGEENARVFAAPLTFLPVVGLLFVALGWRVRLDIKAVRTGEV